MTGGRSNRRLLIVADTLAVGIGDVVREQAVWFAARGWMVRVAAPISASASSLEGARHHRVAIPESARDLRAMRRSIAHVRAILRSDQPDIVQCHGLRSFAVASLAGCRPYVTLHGSGQVSSDPLGYGLIRRIALRVAPWLAIEAFSAGPEQRHGWSFVPHASPRLASLDRSPFPVPDSVPTFLWLGRLSEPKLPSLFIEAISAAARTTPVWGIIAGDGPLSEAAARHIAELGAPIDVIGHSDDVEGLLARSWALVLFSGFEALTFSAQESMWVGRPVISSPLPGIRWLLGDTGSVASDLAEATARVLELADHRVAMERGDRAATRIRELIVPGAPWPLLEARYLARLGDSG